jgi:hypothetical protein
MLEFSWQTRGGETLQIVAHSESVTATANLLIDGTGFDSLPHISDLGCSSSGGGTNHNHNHDAQQQQHHNNNNNNMTLLEESVQTPSTLATTDADNSQGDNDDDGFDDGASTETMSDLGSGDPLDADVKASHSASSPRDDLGYRLSMAGLSSRSGLGSTTTTKTEPVDELHSELYSSTLESLRDQLTEVLPQTEEMVSRAIIQAFFSDCSASSSPHDDMYSSSSGSCAVIDNRDQQVIEADALWEAREWVSLNVDVAPRPDVQELALSYMQKQIEGVFVRVRNEEISSEEAARQLLSVAAVLGLTFNSSVPLDTIILFGLDKLTPLNEFLYAMTAFGPVQAAAISSRGRDFAFCRFMDESAVNGVQEAAKNGRLQVGGSLPSVSVLSEKLYPCDGRKTELHTRERRDDDAPADDSSSLQIEFSGHESAIFPHLMGPLGVEEDLEEEYIGDSSFSSTPDHQHHHHHHHCLVEGHQLMKSRTESTSGMSPSSYPRSSPGSPNSLSHMNLKSQSHHNLGRGQQHGSGAA